MENAAGLRASPYQLMDIVSTLLWVVLPACLIILAAGALVLRSRVRRNRQAHREKLQHVHRSPQSPRRARTVSKGQPNPQRRRSPLTLGDGKTFEDQALSQLEDAYALREKDAIAEYHKIIARVIKQYISKKYEIKVDDVTTAQMLAELPDGAVDYVGEILYTCDIAHFDRYHPSDFDLDNIYYIAWEFVMNHAEASEDSMEEALANLLEERHEDFLEIEDKTEQNSTFTS